MIKINRLLILAVASFTLVSGALTSYAAPAIEHMAKAEALGKLNMFTKSAKGFELERPATRLEAVDTVIRLLGKTAEIKGGVSAGTLSHPFTDVPTQGADVVGYLFTNGYLSDNAAHTFKPGDKMDMNTYCAMLLRAMGYKDENGDYTWATAVDFAVKVGLLNANEVKLIKAQGTQGLMRDELALISYNALKAPLNPAVEGYKGKSLVDLGIEAKAIYTESAVMAGIAKMATYDGILRKPMYEVTYTGIELDGKDQKHEIYLNSDESSKDGKSVIPPIRADLELTYRAGYPSVCDVSTFIIDAERINNVESFAEFNFYAAGKLVMSVTSSIHEIGNVPNVYTPYSVRVLSTPYDEVRIKVYELTNYEIFRKYGNVPVYTYAYKQAKDGISKLKMANYVTQSLVIISPDSKPLTNTAHLFNGLNKSMIFQPGKTPFIPMMEIKPNGEKVVSNMFMMGGKMVGKKNITLLKTDSFPALSPLHNANQQLTGDYKLYINPKEITYFILRDAKFNPIGAVCFKP